MDENVMTKGPEAFEAHARRFAVAAE
jgi:hypothetical protein